MSEPITSIEAAVRELGALPVPVGTESRNDAAIIDRLRERVAELEAFAYGCDAEGHVLPHSSWCEAAKKTAADNDGCTCGQPWADHPQPHAMHCWAVNPPRAEVEEMRRALAKSAARIAELEAERHSTNEALDDAVQALRADGVYRQGTAQRRQVTPPQCCQACGSAPASWCPDCAACEQGCFGGFDGNSCTHANAKWGGAR